MVLWNGNQVWTSREIAKHCSTSIAHINVARPRLKLVENIDFFKLAKEEVKQLKSTLKDKSDIDKFANIYDSLYLYTLSGQSKLAWHFLADEKTKNEATVKAFSKVKEPHIQMYVNDLAVVEHNAQRVLTTEQLAAVYGCTPQNITQNFNNNVERFREGEHYFRLEGTELKAFKREVENFDVVKGNVNTLYLWTERGAHRHCKMLNTTVAWNVFDELEETYFVVKQSPAVSNQNKPMNEIDILLGALNEIKKQQEQVNEHDKRLTIVEKEHIETKKEITSIKEILALRPENFKEDIRKIVAYIAQQRGNGKDDYRDVWNEIYSILKARYGIDIWIRQKNQRKRMKEAGNTKTAIKNLSMLDVASNIPVAVEGIISIVKEFAIKAGITVTAEHEVIEFKVVGD